MDGPRTAPLSQSAPRVASYAQEGLRRGLVGPDGRPDPEAVKNAFEALLLTELFKPFQESLRESGLFPEGAQGDIYASFWQGQLSEVLAASLDLLPGWTPGAEAGAGAEASAAALTGVRRAGESGQDQPLALAKPSFLSLAGDVRALPARENAAGLAGRVAAAAAARARAGTATQPAARETGSARAQARADVPAHLARPPAASASPGSSALASRLAPFEPAIQDAARVTGLEANWLRAVILQESAGQPDAVSPRGAAGLMQLLPTTAAALGVRDLFEPAQNVMAGARYLRSLFQRYGDPRLALAAYNAGPGRVEAYGGIPPFRETRHYVDRVLALKRAFDHSGSEAVAAE